MDDLDGWGDGDRKLVSDVQTHGWHVITVFSEFGTPGWCYTVGLWHTFRSPEVAMFGLRDEDMPHWLNGVGEQVKAGALPRPGELRAGIIDGFDVTWRPVHESWYRELFGYALWFTSPPLPIVQLVWPDREGQFPWDPGVGERCRRDQPQCWQDIGEQHAGPWRPMSVHAAHGWPAPELRCFTTNRIVAGQSDVIAVYRERDGDWQFLDGGSVERDDIAVVHAADLVDRDQTLLDVKDLEAGMGAERGARGEPWRRVTVE